MAVSFPSAFQQVGAEIARHCRSLSQDEKRNESFFAESGVRELSRRQFSFLSALTFLTPSVKAVVPPPQSTQMVVPTIPWDWPDDSNGSAYPQSYEFYSWMPESATPNVPYAASAIRFSDGYRSFLQALLPAPMAQQALNEFEKQQNQVAIIGGFSVQKPAWRVAQYPRQFIASVSGKPPSGYTIRVPLAQLGDPTVKNDSTLFAAVLSTNSSDPVRPIVFACGETQSIDIHADAWGVIPIRPGGWYNSALPKMMQFGPFTPGLSPESFFGPTGVLRCLLTGLFVGFNVTVEASVTPALAGRLQEEMKDANALRVAGFESTTTKIAIKTTDGADAADLSFSPSPPTDSNVTPGAQIVGVTVARLV